MVSSQISIHIMLTSYRRFQFFFFFSIVVKKHMKNLPAVQETQKMWVQSLGQEDSPEDEMVTHSSILAWKIPWAEEPGRL